jgi:GT2 family glycosyltransferase
MTISVIIATYGDPEWEVMAKTRALPSAMGQGLEVLIGHDPDATIAGVRNELAREAKGDLLCFLDADDELAPGYILAMEQMAEKVGPGHLLTPLVQKILRGRARQPAFYDEVNLLTGNWLIVGTVLERELFEKVGGFGEYPHGFEDWALWFKCTKMGAKVKKVRQAVYRQHINPNSKHRQGWKNKRWQVKTHIAVQKELEAWTP